ncbi:MAG TPA: ribonuclease J, partial [Candidatus Fimimorpha faecalis]|nr:ribonuclease J [Candidatus Fimimorpha faecalis]
GHEDHIGALPYILKEVNAPIYATKLTIGIIDGKLKEHNLTKLVKRKIVKYGQSVNLGSFRVEFIRTNHSIVDAAALAIFTPIGTIIHTGDFKIDYTPVFGDSADLQRFGELGKKGVLALLCESTNALRPGFTMSERTVGKTFDSIFAEHRNNRLIVATFASNVDRVQQIINTACKYDRKVVIEGRSMVNIIGTATELGYINVPDGTIIDIEQLKNYPDEKTVIITTGSQGESMAALSRMASSIHRKVSINPKDTIIFSSSPIPGNEKAVDKVINELSMKGAEVIFQDTHVSGHACQEEIKLIYALVRPKYAIPIHGEYRHRIANAEIAVALGVPKEQIFLMQSGDVLEMDQDYAEIVDQVQHGGVLVDGLGVGDVGNIVLRDRQNLSQDGIIIVVLTLEKYTNRLLAGPDIVSRGFVYVRESENLMEEAHQIVADAVESCLMHRISDWTKIKNVIRDTLSEYLWKKMKRSPMILPIIMEVE